MSSISPLKPIKRTRVWNKSVKFQAAHYTVVAKAIKTLRPEIQWEVRDAFVKFFLGRSHLFDVYQFDRALDLDKALKPLSGMNESDQMT